MTTFKDIHCNIYGDIFDSEASLGNENPALPGTHYKRVNILLKTGCVRKGILKTHDCYPGINEYSYCDSSPYANSVVEMDDVQSISPAE